MVNFRIFNIPVCIQPTYFLFVLFFTDILFHPSVYQLIIVFILTGSLLIHELGHALTAKSFGAETNIELEAFGGRANYQASNLSPFKEFVITLNGPLLESLLIFIPLYLLKTKLFIDHPLIQYTLYQTYRINLFWCLLNLIPLIPLDGGHLFRFVFGRLFGPAGIHFSVYLGILVALIALPFFFLKGFYFFSVLLLILGIQNFKSLTDQSILSKYTRVFSSSFQVLGPYQLKKALKLKDPEDKAETLFNLATQYHRHNKSKKAYQILLKADTHFLKEGNVLLCELAYQYGDYGYIVKQAHSIYKNEPCYGIALINSKAFARINQVSQSIGWLKTASLFGKHYYDELLTLSDTQDYALIKNQTEFKSFIKNLKDGKIEA